MLAQTLCCEVRDLRLWKDDIRGAFSQFNFPPKICFLLATQVAKLFIYVDDLIGILHVSTATTDQLVAQEVIKGTFGPEALAAKSVWPCLRGEILARCRMCF